MIPPTLKRLFFSKATVWRRMRDIGNSDVENVLPILHKRYKALNTCIHCTIFTNWLQFERHLLINADIKQFYKYVNSLTCSTDISFPLK